MVMYSEQFRQSTQKLIQIISNWIEIYIYNTSGKISRLKSTSMVYIPSNIIKANVDILAQIRLILINKSLPKESSLTR